MRLGLTPSDFWKMSPDEVGEWFNANRPRKMIAGTTEDNMKMLTDMINENPEEFS